MSATLLREHWNGSEPISDRQGLSTAERSQAHRPVALKTRVVGGLVATSSATNSVP
jgi:hypothetical protein